MAKKMYSGDTKTFRVSAYQKLSNGQADLDNPVSLTGSRVEFTLKNDDDYDGAALVYKSSDNGSGEVEILAAPDDHRALIKLLSADTQELEEGDYLFDVQATFPSTGQKQTIYKDLLCISSDVTRT